MRTITLILLVIASLGAVGCGTDSPTTSSPPTGQKYPDIVSATAERSGDKWEFDVTVSSPYDTPERYADGWRVLAPDGTVLGEHTLAHDHATEQPFTRRQTGVRIPDGVDRVTIEGRDRANGYGGRTVDIAITS